MLQFGNVHHGLANQLRYSVGPVVTYANGYEGGLVEETTTILFTFTTLQTNACRMYNVGAMKDFRTLHEQVNKIFLINLNLPSPSNGLIKTCIFFFVACVILRILFKFRFSQYTCLC